MSNKYLGSLSKKWSKGSRVKFSTNKSMAFVEDLAELAQPYGFRVYVTSAYRSPADQARVVCNNVVNTNGKNLSIYGEVTRKIYRKYCPHNMTAIVEYETKKLADAIRKNPKHEGHGTGYAVDLSVSGMSYNAKVQYKKLIESMGAKVLWEKSPEHFHVVLYSYNPVDYGWTKILAYGGLLTSLGLTGLLTYLIGKRKGWWPFGSSNNHENPKNPFLQVHKEIAKKKAKMKPEPINPETLAVSKKLVEKITNRPTFDFDWVPPSGAVKSGYKTPGDSYMKSGDEVRFGQDWLRNFKK